MKFVNSVASMDKLLKMEHRVKRVGNMKVKRQENRESLTYVC